MPRSRAPSPRRGRGRRSHPPTGPRRCAASRRPSRRDRGARAARGANSGHPIGQARWEAGHVRDVLNYYAAAPERMIGQQIPVAGGIDVTFHEPLGVVGIIVPWNFPMTIAAWGFAPALAAGNAVVLKPAEWTPLTAIRLGELALEAGLPEGLFQVLPGKGSVVGRALRHARAACARSSSPARPRSASQVMAGCCGAGQARHARARRQEREHRLRRLPTSRRPRPRRRTRCSTTPGRTAARAAASSSSAASSTGSSSCSSPR